MPKKGRPTTFSKKSDAAALFRELRRQGMGFRKAEAAIEALMGVGKGELARGSRVPFEPLSEESDTNMALCAISSHAGLIWSRIRDADTGATEILPELPEAALRWIRNVDPRRRQAFSQGT